MSLFISIDPGNKKCGLLLADIKSGNVIEAGISSLNKFSDVVSLWDQNFNISNLMVIFCCKVVWFVSSVRCIFAKTIK